MLFINGHKHAYIIHEKTGLLLEGALTSGWFFSYSQFVAILNFITCVVVQLT